jgi:hypothetical protein
MLINWLADTLKAKMKLATGDMIYSNFKIFIDQDGFITDASPSGSAGHFIPKYLPEIVNIIKGIKLIPFKGKNGKNYSSYTDVYISIIPKNFSR